MLLSTVLHNSEVPSASPAQIRNKAPGEEDQIPFFFATEPNWEELVFLKNFPHKRFHFGVTIREMPITPSQYIHLRLRWLA